MKKQLFIRVIFIMWKVNPRRFKTYIHCRRTSQSFLCIDVNIPSIGNLGHVCVLLKEGKRYKNV